MVMPADSFSKFLDSAAALTGYSFAYNMYKYKAHPMTYHEASKYVNDYIWNTHEAERRNRGKHKGIEMNGRTYFIKVSDEYDPVAKAKRDSIKSVEPIVGISNPCTAYISENEKVCVVMSWNKWQFADETHPDSAIFKIDNAYVDLEKSGKRKQIKIDDYKFTLLDDNPFRFTLTGTLTYKKKQYNFSFSENVRKSVCLPVE